ncbi:MAG: hypothetical protein PHZ14_10980 [Sulfuricella sp.]|jgi:hypothetical protein|nr:hypothetical protein [Sulfuricella sp.]
MNTIPVIGLHTPAQTAALQQATGMQVVIGRRGARLVPVESFKGLIDIEETNQARRSAENAA